MTNVPGAGFVALLAVMAVLLMLPVLAGVSMLVSQVLGLRIEWSLLAHSRDRGRSLRGRAHNRGSRAGRPIAAGAAVAVFIVGVAWRRGVRYATADCAIGGVGGALAGLVLVGQIEVAAAGAVLAAPAALCGLAFERAAARSGRFLRAA